MPEHTTPGLTGDDRCWPCTVANALAGLLVAAVPLLAAVVRGDPALVGLALTWALAVGSYTSYRLFARGHLPYAETVARRTRLNDRIGPGGKN